MQKHDPNENATNKKCEEEDDKQNEDKFILEAATIDSLN